MILNPVYSTPKLHETAIAYYNMLLELGSTQDVAWVLIWLISAKNSNSISNKKNWPTGNWQAHSLPRVRDLCSATPLMSMVRIVFAKETGTAVSAAVEAGHPRYCTEQTPPIHWPTPLLNQCRSCSYQGWDLMGRCG